jgi:hypothetical protein
VGGEASDGGRLRIVDDDYVELAIERSRVAFVSL